MTIMEKGALVRAIYTNHPEAKNELFFRKGEILTVVEYDYEGQPGWWLCSLRGQRGICPSNYLEVLEDKYSVPKIQVHDGMSYPGTLKRDESQCNPTSSSSSQDCGRSEFVNPLETYDFPRSVQEPVQVNEEVVQRRIRGGGGGGGLSTSAFSIQSTSSALSRSRLSLEEEPEETEHIYCNDEPQPLYQNIDALLLQPENDRIEESSSSSSLPVIQAPENSSSYSPESLSPITKTSPLDLYDVPRVELPIYGQSLTRLRKYGSCTGTDSFDGAQLSKRFPELANNHKGALGTLSASTLGLSRGSRVSPPLPTSGGEASAAGRNQEGSLSSGRGGIITQTKSISQISGQLPVILRRNKIHQQPIYNNISNRSSVQSSESAESGIVMVSSGQMQELYDVPRGTSQTSTSVANLVNHFNKSTTTSAPSSSSSHLHHHLPPPHNGVSTSRPSSALSVTSSGMGMSIATSDSKDSLDCLYDVPRTSMKAYVNHMETKYDDLVRRRHDSTSSYSGGGGYHQPSHTRHNSTSSIFSAYGYSSKGPTGPNNGSRMDSSSRTPSLFSIGANGSGESLQRNQSVDELYDVPRGTTLHPLASRNGGGVGAMGPPPPILGRKPIMNSVSSGINKSSVSNGSLNSDGDDPMQFYDVPREFSRKASLQESSKSDTLTRKGTSSASLNSSSQSLHHFRPPSTNMIHCSNLKLDGGGGGSGAEVKLLPLGAKAAVSVCEKLRQEVVSSINSILNNVKPKWRSKENLTEIMPDLKFSCTRLSLAIKDVADFASRSLSNAKRHTDDSISVRLHRLLTPVINGSQIIQRDVDELEAYFWSVDRLSVFPGSEHDSGSNASGDALDQLILCSRSLKHDVTELANFLALHSTALYKEAPEPVRRNGECAGGTSVAASGASPQAQKRTTPVPTVVEPDTKVDDTQDDYDYVSLVPTGPGSVHSSNSLDSQKLFSSSLSDSGSTSTVSWHLDSRDQQLLEFYSAQITVTAPQLSQSIATFISAINQNEPPSVFNIHLKYVILLAYKLLFAGDTVHRNISNSMLKEEVELKANDLHKSILGLYEASKVATVEFPKITPMQTIVDRVWGTTQAATQLKKVIFNAVYTAV